MKKRLILISILLFSLLLCACSDNRYSELQQNYNSLYASYKNVVEKYKATATELNTANITLKQYSDIISIEDEIRALKSNKADIEHEIIQLDLQKLNIEKEIETLSITKNNITSSFTLSQGNYIVGVDVPIGKYTVTAISGSGNFYGTIASLGILGLNEIMAEPDSVLYGNNNVSYNNLVLDADDNFAIGSGLTLQFDKIN